MVSKKLYYPAYPYPISDLLDRMSICQLKAIFIHEHKEQYEDEIKRIQMDIDHLIRKKGSKFTAEMLHASMIVAISNFCIWMNESKARKGGVEQDTLLKFTHSVNGIRNTAKNILSKELGDRMDLKIDCLAAEFLTEEFIKQHGNWNVWEKKK